MRSPERGFAAAHGGKAPPFRWVIDDESRLRLARRHSRRIEKTQLVRKPQAYRLVLRQSAYRAEKLN